MGILGENGRPDKLYLKRWLVITTILKEWIPAWSCRSEGRTALKTMVWQGCVLSTNAEKGLHIVLFCFSIIIQVLNFNTTVYGAEEIIL
jgi:hypothetical protein